MNKTVAIVVTYNRKDILKNNIESAFKKVNEKLEDGFDKTNKTFNEVLIKISLIKNHYIELLILC